MSSSAENLDPLSPTPASAPSPTTRTKLRKIPPIPIRRGKHDHSECEHQRHHHDDSNVEQARGDDNKDDDSSILLASTLGLNHIRTKSVSSSPSPLRFSSAAGTPLSFTNEAKKDKTDTAAADAKPKYAVPPSSKTPSLESGFIFIFIILNCYLIRNQYALMHFFSAD